MQESVPLTVCVVPPAKVIVMSKVCVPLPTVRLENPLLLENVAGALSVSEPNVFSSLNSDLEFIVALPEKALANISGTVLPSAVKEISPLVVVVPPTSSIESFAVAPTFPAKTAFPIIFSSRGAVSLSLSTVLPNETVSAVIETSPARVSAPE